MLANSLASRQSLTQPAVPSITKPQEFSPLPAPPPTSGGRARPSSWDGSREDTGQGSGHGTNTGGHVLPAQPWHGQGLAAAQLDVLHQAWDAAGAAYLPHAGPPCSLISPSQPWPCSPGLQTARGGCAPTPGSIPQDRGMGQSIQPFPGRVEIIPSHFQAVWASPDRSVTHQDTSAKAWVILQPQGSNRSLPLRPRRDFFREGRMGFRGEPECSQLLPTLSLASAARKKKGGLLLFSFLPLSYSFAGVFASGGPRVWRGSRTAEALLKTKQGACMHTHTHGIQPCF